MCNTGGPRCEYSQKWLSRRRKLQRTDDYKNASRSRQKGLERTERWRFQKEYSEEYQKHLPERAKWQRKAKALPRRKAEALARSQPPPKIFTAEEAVAHTAAMAEEHEELLKRLSPDEVHALILYTMASHEDINGYLRLGAKGVVTADEYPNDDRVGFARERVAHLDAIFEKAYKHEEPRTLYRHMLVEPGMSPRRYAEKYFKVGERVADPAFMSTSEDPSYIRGHVHKRRPSEYLVMKIVTRKGISLQQYEEEFNGNIQSWEKERLLPRDTKLRVLAVRNEEYSIDDSRYQMKKQFGNGWGQDKILPKRLTTVVLIDEDEL